MSNMSYCRFENTYNDLLECQQALDEDGVIGVECHANNYERPYIRQLIELCQEIVVQYADDLE